MSISLKTASWALALVLGLGLSGVTATGAAAENCRWKTKLVKYRVTNDGGERRLETAVAVNVTNSTVRHPKRGYKRLKEDETEYVNKTVKTVTVHSRQEYTLHLDARERDLGASGVLAAKKITLDCDSSRSEGKSRTQTYKVKHSSGWVYKIWVAFEKV